MSDITRVPLSDNEVEAVAGGNVLYVCNGNDVYCWGASTPDVRYGFNSLRALLTYVDAHYDYYGEGGIFQAMLAEGIIFPL